MKSYIWDHTMGIFNNYLELHHHQYHIFHVNHLSDNFWHSHSDPAEMMHWFAKQPSPIPHKID